MFKPEIKFVRNHQSRCITMTGNIETLERATLLICLESKVINNLVISTQLPRTPLSAARQDVLRSFCKLPSINEDTDGEEDGTAEEATVPAVDVELPTVPAVDVTVPTVADVPVPVVAKIPVQVLPNSIIKFRHEVKKTKADSMERKKLVQSYLSDKSILNWRKNGDQRNNKTCWICSKVFKEFKGVSRHMREICKSDLDITVDTAPDVPDVIEGK